MLQKKQHAYYDKLRIIQLFEGDVDIASLLLQGLTPLLDEFQEIAKLSRLARIQVIHVNDFPDFAEREAKTLASQDQLEADAVARAIDPLPAAAPRGQEAFVLVEADGPSGDAELFCQLGDGIGGAFRAVIGY